LQSISTDLILIIDKFAMRTESGVNHGGAGRDCPIQSFDWGTALLTVPQSSSLGGTLLGLAS